MGAGPSFLAAARRAEEEEEEEEEEAGVERVECSRKYSTLPP
jgi:hypothetical protein